MCAQGGDGLCQDLEPCLCAEGEEHAFIRNTLSILLDSKQIIIVIESYILHDHVVGGDAISRNEEEGLVVDFIQVAYFPPGDKRQSALEIGLGV